MPDKRLTIEGRDRHIEKLLRYARNHGISVREVPVPAKRAKATKAAKK